MVLGGVRQIALSVKRSGHWVTFLIVYVGDIVVTGIDGVELELSKTY